MTATVATARRLLEQASGYPVLSLFLDLDPEQFATAPARATQLRSLVDEANRAIAANDSLDHDERKALKDDVERVESFLQSDDAPISGARALAVFSSGAAGLFEAVPLAKPVAPRVVASRMVYVEPLVADEDADRWCVALVSRNT